MEHYNFTTLLHLRENSRQAECIAFASELKCAQRIYGLPLCCSPATLLNGVKQLTNGYHPKSDATGLQAASVSPRAVTIFVGLELGRKPLEEARGSRKNFGREAHRKLQLKISFEQILLGLCSL